MKTKIIGLFLIGILGFTACEKENEIVQQDTDRETLEELTVMEESTDNFLVTGEQFNNTDIYKRYVENQQDRFGAVWWAFNFRWGWTCTGWFGMCNIVPQYPWPFLGPPVGCGIPFPWGTFGHSSVAGAVDAGAEGKKLQVYPRPEDLAVAFTEDGFFPIGEDVALPEDACDALELPAGTLIQSGIYAANLGETGEYESVTLNLIY